MLEDTSELSTFIRNMLESIRQGIGGAGFELRPPVVFDLAVVKTKEAEGKLRVFVVDAGGKYQKEAISRVKFEVGYKSDSEQKEQV